MVAPLDWGLGHAARCIPVIKELQNYPFRIIIAADGPVKTMLKQEFPQLQFINLQGYNIKYSKNKRWFRFKLLIQFPKILSTIVKEHRWLNKVIKELGIDAVISDNRFGLYHPSIPCVYITHQLFIKTGNRISDVIATTIHKKYIKNYTQCWIPDYEGKINISGELSHYTKIPLNAVYIGCLSRFEPAKTAENTVDLLIILSGPEPQRSIFENKLMSQLSDFNGSALLVRGLPDEKDKVQLPERGSFSGKVTFENHLSAADLSKVMQSASLIISRSGYTTIMDLLKLGRKALLVPTPGQTEQEYLAAYLSAKQLFCTAAQEDFSLRESMAMADQFAYQMPAFNMELYRNIIRQFAETI
ncbi:MAG: glycosyltransferase [Chitinophagaceae bacterium]|nr:glycosyltransferase [Chitinophagaceae bacterium]